MMMMICVNYCLILLIFCIDCSRTVVSELDWLDEVSRHDTKIGINLSDQPAPDSGEREDQRVPVQPQRVCRGHSTVRVRQLA